MSTVYLDDSILTGIANSIRTKLGSQDTFYPNQMSSAIDSIGGGEQCIVGTFNYSTSRQTTVTLGFKPKQLFIWMPGRSPMFYLTVYDERYSTTSQVYVYTGGMKEQSLNSSSHYCGIYQINDTGFIVNIVPDSQYITGYYFAIG